MRFGTWRKRVGATAVLLLALLTLVPGVAGAASTHPEAAVAGFTAELTAEGQVILNWETVSERDNAGFNIYRGHAESGPWARANTSLIAAVAPGSGKGQAYGWSETPADAESRHWYVLESVTVDGATNRHGPVSAGFDVPNAVRLETFDAQSAGELIPIVLLSIGTIALAIISRRNGGGGT
jgi:hypothetical protein